MTLHIAALASGAGTNVAAIMTCIRKSGLDASLELVLTNNPGAPVLKLAQAEGVAVWAGDHRDFPDRAAFDREMLAAVKAAGADTIVLAGYMRLLSPFFIRAFPGRILNIHPALLPSFPGVHSLADALAHGVRFTGATVHFVDDIPDNGPIIIQAVLPVDPSETGESLLRRVHALEHRIYPQALQWLAEGRLEIENRRVRLLPGRTPHAGRTSSGRNEQGPWLISPELEGF
jgi:phosphoribosylglycinamide formyltransferase-1